MNLIAVTVHYGNPETTARLLSRLVTYDTISSIIVVLHDSLPAAPKHPRLTYLEEENRGYAAGLNLALQHIRKVAPEAEQVLALNPDVQISESQVLELLHSHLATGGDCTFPTISEAGLLIHGYRFTKLGTMRLVNQGAELFPGTCFLFSTVAWEKAGGFNEEYFHYYEDMDFCLRLKRAGCHIHHAPEVVVEHEGKSGADYPGTSLPRYAVRNHLLFLSQLRPLNFLSVCNVAARHFLYLFRWKHGWRGFREWLGGIREFRTMNRARMNTAQRSRNQSRG